MVKNKKKSTPFLTKLRNYFITGIVVLVPIGITLYLTKFFISISSRLIPKEINPNSYLPFSIPGLEIILSIIFITSSVFFSLYIGTLFPTSFCDINSSSFVQKDHKAVL